ncbi:MAG: TonB-dependent receptor, partial [Bacteroidales bacterium]|nr:TonB-dependent receptor [Bacteroidales bacterium]
KPEFEAKWSVNYRLNAQWSFETEVIALGERFAAGKVETLFKPIRLKPLVDLNIEATYRFTEQFSIFVQGNNMLNNRYERFYNYPVQGLQLLGGIKVLF